MRLKIATACFILFSLHTLPANADALRSISNNIFVYSAGSRELVMLRVIATGPNKVSGSIVDSKISRRGVIKKDTVTSVNGRVFHNNISLDIGGPGDRPFGTAPWVGEIKNNSMLLMAGNMRMPYTRVTYTQYQAILRQLYTKAKHLATIYKFTVFFTGVKNQARSVRAYMKEYYSWGNRREKHVSVVHNFYAKRRLEYSNCLNHIKPLATEGVASWHWQNCVLAVQNDDYYINSMKSSILHRASQLKGYSNKIEEGIHKQELDFSAILDRRQKVCVLVVNPSKCTDAFKKLANLKPYGFISSKEVAVYRKNERAITSAVDQELSIYRRNESVLENMSREISKIYHNAHN